MHPQPVQEDCPWLLSRPLLHKIKASRIALAARLDLRLLPGFCAGSSSTPGQRWPRRAVLAQSRVRGGGGQADAQLLRAASAPPPTAANGHAPLRPPLAPQLPPSSGWGDGPEGHHPAPTWAVRAARRGGPCARHVMPDPDLDPAAARREGQAPGAPAQ